MKVRPLGAYPLMFRVVMLQAGATGAAMLVALALGGWWALLSALAGGICSVGPNAWFALRLWRSLGRAGGVNPASVLAGEFVKIAMSISLLVACAVLIKTLNWWAFLAAFVLALKSPLLLLMTRMR